ncbi:flagellar assembly protein FliH [Shewanella denitrificans OS217]|jgi:flagellar assembly protein FliH|uniref:Flagellar assembly protein FliH n=1 Tax=Shewanella denitrificans (strain OS217 / ATCC BAA-1090 / DSM 15013) TaxID=318161 RepID=Q12HZ4_SHEDO|nr:flagellar assembly protein FliH [Shewanella denitrificans]ABE56932.1 flagellar assembly protein FliH [Shewanella denitrificans OS217]
MNNKHNPWRLDPKLARRYRFPALIGEAVSSNDSSEWQNYQQAFEQGYQEGSRQGQEQGLAAGTEEGLQRGHAQGVKQGLLEGQQQGKQSIDEQFNQLIVPLAALKSLLEEGHAEQVRNQQDLILDLVRRVSQQVIRCELTLQPQQILKLVEETLSALPNDKGEIKIHLEPSAVTKLKELGEDKLRGWQLVSDASISAGSCRIVSDKSDADASIETRLEACMEQVEAKLNEVEIEG